MSLRDAAARAAHHQAADRGLAGRGAPGRLREHLDVYGPLPSGRRGHPDPRALLDAVTAAGLTGRGGAGFPTGTKLRAVAARRGRAVVVANGMESEPASEKDQALLARAPHLVLDGAAMAARAVGADIVHICLDRTRRRQADDVLQAIAERREARLDDAQFLVHELPHRYVSSEETALVRWLNGGEAKPTATPPRPFERGVERGPTLVDNVETLAHIALIGRYGPRWFREAGRPDAPGTMLVTVAGAVSQPGVYEIEAGIRIGDVLTLADAADVGAVLVGGYFGTWHDPRQVSGLPLTKEGLRPVGGGARRRGAVRAARRAAAGSPRRRGSWATWPARARSSAGRACSACPPSPMTSPSSRPGSPRAICCGGWTGGSRSSPAAAPAVTRTARSAWRPRH